jgi:hypothetical protein
MIGLSKIRSSTPFCFLSNKSISLSLYLIFTLFIPLAHSADVTVAWDSSPSPGVAGYKVYVGTSSRNYTATFDAGSKFQLTVPDLQAGNTYFLAATAYDTQNKESGFSEEISYQVPVTSPGTDPPQVTTPNYPSTGKGSSNAPVAINSWFSTSTSSNLVGQVESSANNGDSLIFSSVDLPKNGSLIEFNPDGKFTYSPNPDFTGEDSFTFSVSSGGQNSKPATVTIIVSKNATIAIEAEAGSLTKPMSKYRSRGASGNLSVMVPRSRPGLTSPDQKGGTAEYVIHVPVSGEYRVWGRVTATKPASNAFYISFDNGQFTQWQTALGAVRTWIWDYVRELQRSEASVFYLAAGRHVLTVKGAESGCRLDRLVLTKIRLRMWKTQVLRVG